ncbi:MAG TPA: hypothetical protein VNO70_01125 [Blastocatellia bacterium]|nr:hypothetical protein [Blastocatellia bacterium]
MSSDDQTRILPEGEADKPLDTKPMLEAILDRLNALTQDVRAIRAEMEKGFAEVQQQFRVLNKKFDILAQDVMQVRADQQLLEDRVTKLEQKPS